MPANSMICFEHYVVNKIDFQLNPNFDSKTTKGIRIEPHFTRKHKKVDEDRLQVELGVQMECDLFRMHVVLNGLFNCHQWEANPPAKEMLLTNTSAILFPYLRSVVSNTTLSANIPIYTIPVMNIIELFKDQ